MTELKDKFKFCMNLMYPDGVANMDQHRDLIRTFAMGWLEALLFTDQKDGVKTLLEEYLKLCNPNWLPDESWQWW